MKNDYFLHTLLWGKAKKGKKERLLPPKFYQSETVTYQA